MTQRVYLALPCYTGTIHLGTFHSIIQDIAILNGQGVAVRVHEEAGNAMIAHGRSVLLAQFLASDCTDLFFIDDDVQWEPGGIPRLLKYPVDIVAGIYPRRADPLGFNCRYIYDRPEIWSNEMGLIEVEGVPAGFTRITRACIEKMVAAYPEKRFRCKDAPNGHAWALFDNIHEGEDYYGEDYSFCRRFFKIGGKIWVDPNIGMGHVGNKMFWGKFGDWLKSRDKQ